jgi:hypothetical protein
VIIPPWLLQGESGVCCCPYHVFVYYSICLCANLIVGFLARDCHEGIQTCDLWVLVLIRTYRRLIVESIPDFPGQHIAVLLVAHWLERFCASLTTQVRFLACSIQRQLLQGEAPSCCFHPSGFCVLHA